MITRMQTGTAWWPALPNVGDTRSTPLPQRSFALIDGVQEKSERVQCRLAHSDLHRTARRHIHQKHRASCALDRDALLFHRMGCKGMTSDITALVRAVALAMGYGKQLVVLPPTRQRGSMIEKFYQTCTTASLPENISNALSYRDPWHWLVLTGIPLDAIYVKSACHVELERKHPTVLQTFADHGIEAGYKAAAQSGVTLAIGSREYAYFQKKGVFMSSISVPPECRAAGMLWWFEVLTSCAHILESNTDALSSRRD